MSARIDAVSALLWSPFVGTLLLLGAIAVAYVARRERRNPFAISPSAEAARAELRQRAGWRQS